MFHSASQRMDQTLLLSLLTSGCPFQVSAQIPFSALKAKSWGCCDVAQWLTLYTLFVWTYQQNQQPSSSVFLSQQTSEQCFQHNKPAKRTG
jgi:hypothetical protein